nr:hypothetical protein [Angustibacter aerolatus]
MAAASAPVVALLPGERSAFAAAGEAGRVARSHGLTVVVLTTHAPVQVLAALAVLDPEATASEALVRMSAAAAATRYASVLRPAPDAATGRLGGDAGAVVHGSDPCEVSVEVAERLLADGGEPADARDRCRRRREPGRRDGAGAGGRGPARRRGARRRRRPAVVGAAAGGRVSAPAETDDLARGRAEPAHRRRATGRREGREGGRAGLRHHDRRAPAAALPAQVRREGRASPTSAASRLDEHVTVVARVKQATSRRMQQRRGAVVNVVISDGSSEPRSRVLRTAPGDGRDLRARPARRHAGAVLRQGRALPRQAAPGAPALRGAARRRGRRRRRRARPATGRHLPRGGRHPVVAGRRRSARSSRPCPCCPTRCRPTSVRAAGCSTCARRCSGCTRPQTSSSRTSRGTGCATRRRSCCRPRCCAAGWRTPR